MKYHLKIIVILIILIIINSFWILNNRENNKKTINISKKPDAENTVKEENKTIEMCYYYSEKNNSPFEDRAWVKLNILGEKITGEYQNLPAEKDSKIGAFIGTVGDFDPKLSGRKAKVIWDTFAEGLNAKEELYIVFGEGSAVAFFGEMIEQDGIYVYKNPENLSPSFTMSQVDCESLNERLVVEKYLRENIKEIATNSPVLGGNWYLISSQINTFEDQANIVYEDGHIQSKAEVKYSFDPKTSDIKIIEFKVLE